MVSFTVTMRRHLIHLASAPFASFHLAKFGWLSFADLCVQRLATKPNAGFTEVGKNFGPILSRFICGPKFMKFSDDVGDPHTFQSPCRLSRAYIVFHSEDNRHIVEKRNKCIKFFGRQVFGRDKPNFSTADYWIYCPPFGKVWLSSVCWSPPRKAGNEVESRIYGWWIKTPVLFLPVCTPEFTKFSDDVGDPSYF